MGSLSRVNTYIYKKSSKIYTENDNMIIVSNGSVMWSYDKVNNKVMVLESNFSNREPIKLDYTEIIKDLLERYDVQLLGGGESFGEGLLRPESEAKGDEGNITKMWVDKEFWLPIKMEYKFGEFSMFIEYRNLSINTGIDDSFFEFKPPEGAEVGKNANNASGVL